MTSALRADGPPVLHRLVLRALPRDRAAGFVTQARLSPQERRRASRTPWRGPPFPAVPAPAPGHRRARSPAPGAQARAHRARAHRPGAVRDVAVPRPAERPDRLQQPRSASASTEIVPAGRLLAELANARALAVRSAGGDAEATADAARRAQDASPHAVAALDAADRRLGSAARDRRDVEAPAHVDPGDRRRAPDRRAPRRSPPTTASPPPRVALIVQAGNESNLILDPDLDSVLRDGRAGQQGAARAGHRRAGDQPRDRDGRLRAQHRGRAHRARGRPGRDGERRGRHPLGPEDRLRGHVGPRAAEDPHRAAGADLGLDRRAQPRAHARRATAGPTGPPRRSSARTPSPAPPPCRRSSPPRSTACSPPASTTCAPSPAAPTSSSASASRSPPTSSWPSSSP